MIKMLLYRTKRFVGKVMVAFLLLSANFIIPTFAAQEGNAVEDTNFEDSIFKEYRKFTLDNPITYTHRPKFNRGEVFVSSWVGAPDNNGLDLRRLNAINVITEEVREVLQTGSARLHDIIFLQNHLVTFGPQGVTVYERNSFKKLASKRLRDGILDAQIKGDTLYLFQQNSGSEFLVSRFQLPSFQFLDETVLPRVNKKILSGLFTKKGYVTFSQRTNITRPYPYIIQFYDFDGALEKEITLKSDELNKRNNCGNNMRRLSGRYLFVQQYCGHYFLIDIEKQTINFKIPPFRDSNFSWAAVDNGLLFMRPSDSREGISNEEGLVSIYDLETSQELARRVLPPGEIFAGEGQLVVVSPQAQYGVNRKKLFIHSYVYDEDEIRDLLRPKKDIFSARDAALNAPDPYQALDIFETRSLGILEQARHQPVENDIYKAAFDYAKLLAVNPYTNNEGVEWLKGLVSQRPADSEIQVFLEAAELRTALFSENGSIREKAIEGIWAPASDRAISRAHFLSRDIPVADSSVKTVLFDANRVYYRCYECPDETSIGFHVFDRSDWSYITFVNVTNTTGDKQENIKKIIATKDEIIVEISNRYPDENDINHFVYDKKTLALKIKGHLPHTGSIYKIDDEINSCDCNANMCRKVDMQTLTLFTDRRSATDMIVKCDFFGAILPSKLYNFIIEQYGDFYSRLRRVFENYALVGLGVYNRPFGQSAFIALGDNLKEVARFPKVIDSDFFGHFYFSQEQDYVVMAHRAFRNTRFYGFDLNTGDYKVLLELSNDVGGVGASDGRSMFLNIGDSIFAFDLRTGEVLDAFLPNNLRKPLIESQPQDMVFSNLWVDKDNLLTLKGNGMVEIYSLDEFYKSIDRKKNPYINSRDLLASEFQN